MENKRSDAKAVICHFPIHDKKKKKKASFPKLLN